MAVMDEFKSERESVKNEPFKKKVAYFWTYYKWFVIIPLIIIIGITSYIYHIVTDTDTVLNGILLNTNSLESDSSNLIDGFYEEQQIDQKLYDISLNPSLSYYPDSQNASSNYTTLQALMAWSSSGAIDFISGDMSAMKDLAYKGYFVDLTTVLSAEQLTTCEPYFLYIDQDIVTQRNEAFDNNSDASTIPLPDCDKPETMKDPIPVLLNLPPSDALKQAYGFTSSSTSGTTSDSASAATSDSASDAVIFGIVQNAQNTDMALKFIEYATKPTK